MKFTGTFRLLSFNREGYIKATENQLKAIMKKAAKAFYEAAIAKVPYRTGFTQGAFGNLADVVGASTSVAKIVTNYGKLRRQVAKTKLRIVSATRIKFKDLPPTSGGHRGRGFQVKDAGAKEKEAVSKRDQVLARQFAKLDKLEAANQHRIEKVAKLLQNISRKPSRRFKIERKLKDVTKLRKLQQKLNEAGQKLDSMRENLKSEKPTIKSLKDMLHVVAKLRGAGGKPFFTNKRGRPIAFPTKGGLAREFERYTHTDGKKYDKYPDNALQFATPTDQILTGEKTVKSPEADTAEDLNAALAATKFGQDLLSSETYKFIGQSRTEPQSRSSFKIPIFHFGIDITYFNINDVNSNPRTPSAPWRSFEAGRKAMIAYLEQHAFRAMPRLEDYVFATQTEVGSKKTTQQSLGSR